MPRPRELLDVSSAGVARIRTAIEAARAKAQLAREESARRRTAQTASKPLSIPIPGRASGTGRASGALDKQQTKKQRNRKLEGEGGEDQARLDASAAALERKAALYDELSARGGGGGAGVAGEECSVDFEQKRQQRREETATVAAGGGGGRGLSAASEAWASLPVAFGRGGGARNVMQRHEQQQQQQQRQAYPPPPVDDAADALLAEAEAKVSRERSRDAAASAAAAADEEEEAAEARTARRRARERATGSRRARARYETVAALVAEVKAKKMRT